MAKERFSASVSTDVAEQLDDVANKSELVEDLLRSHFASAGKTEAERIRTEIQEEEDKIEELEEQIEEHEAKIAYLESELEDIDDERQDTIDQIVEYAKKYATQNPEQRDFARKQTDKVAGLPAQDVIPMLDDVVADTPIKQVRATGSWDDLSNKGYDMTTHGHGINEELSVSWDARARDIVGLTAEQREAIEDWFDDQ